MHFDLERFVTAQSGVHADALAELQAGRKRSHWMWFVFPQLRGLGRSANAYFFGIASGAEARAYLAHPVLGARLGACTHAVLEHRGKGARDIFGTPDDLKFHSSLTLFAAASADANSIFTQALAAFFDGVPDERTVEKLTA